MVGRAANLHDLLQDWPYARDYLLSTMDGDLIERHAVLQLSRALNIGSVIGFLSAGVSMAYGRISWHQLVAELVRDVTTNYRAVAEEYSKDKDASGEPIQAPPRLKKLYENIVSLNIDGRTRGDNIKADRYPSVFQLCEELSLGLSEDPKFRTLHNLEETTRSDLFLDGVKLRTRDGHYHAISLLKKYLRRNPPTPPDRLDIEVDALDADWAIYSPIDRTQLFTFECVIDFMLSLDEALKKRVDSLIALGTSASSSRLKPSLRFLAVASMASATTDERNAIADQIASYRVAMPRANKPGRTKQPPRLQAAADIVGTLRSRLGISRFLTTNFDLEVERLSYEQGYRASQPTPPAGTDVFIDPLKRTARDFVVRREHTAALADLALQASGHHIDIAHLHGRALPGEPLVATESQYQDLYLFDDRHRDPLDEAIRLTFRGNTLLFVGSGMGEDDILRPLRHFMTEAGGPTQPPSIALLPLSANESTVIEEKIALLRRYGVYSIHWGRGRTSAMVKARAKAGPVLRHVRALLRAAKATLGSSGPTPKHEGEWTEAVGAAKAAEFLDGDGNLLDLVEIETLTEGEVAYGASVRLSDMIGVEWATLRFIFRAAEAFSTDWKVTSDVLSARVMAGEMEDAVMSAFLAATVLMLAREWEGWKSGWFGEINSRPAAPNLENTQANATQAMKWRAESFKIARRRALALKHVVRLPSDGPDNVPASDRSYRPRWSQAYSDFLGALREGAREGHIAKEGRRIFFLAGRRGLGKGHFFSALTDPTSFLDYATSAGSAELVYGLYAFNLSFSVELGSGFEIMAEFIYDRIQAIYDDQLITNRDSQKLSLKTEYDRFKSRDPGHSGDRVGALRFLFDVMAGRATVAEYNAGHATGAKITLEKPTGRIVLALNATHLLFNPRGFAKSSDVVRFFQTFLDPNLKSACLDLLFVSSEPGLPIEIREPMPRLVADPSRFGVGGELPVQVVELVHLAAVGQSAVDAQDDAMAISRQRLRIVSAEELDSKKTAAFFHRLQQPRISVVVMTAFPRIALLLAGSCKSLRGRSFEPSAFRNADFSTVFGDAGVMGEKTRISREAASVTVARKAVDSLAPRDTTISVEGLAGEIDRKFAELYKRLGRNRFCISIVCAAVDDVLDMGGGITDASVRLEGFFRSIAGLSDQSREDAVLHQVLEYYRIGAERGVGHGCQLYDQLEQVALAWKHRIEGADSTVLLGQCAKEPGFWSSFQTLQEELMAVLAMIGVPVEADCLSHLRIGAWADLINKRTGWPDNDGGRTYLIELALECLVRRALVFRFVDRSASKSLPKFRFGVHRLVQRLGLRRMHQPRVEFPQVDSYMPTLYASQPNDLPYPTADAQESIRDLVARLSFYPKRSRWGTSGLLPTIEPERAARMLRAAYGILRSVYSIASVARFDAYVPAIAPPSHGFFEEHRHNIRWVLRRAKSLQEQLGKDGAYEYPFFSGDIVWLYNECGALSLLQGSLHDASRLFAEALRVVQRIESPAIGGALTNAVRLNRALVDIEMGKLRKADTALQDIALNHAESRPVRWIALGYRGLVAHIRGDTKFAEESYQSSMAALRSMKRHRAASIFARHCADLYRQSSPSRIDLAVAMADDAVKFASIGNHEDVYHLARLTRLRAQLEARRQNPERLADAVGTDSRTTLTSIETYGKIMGMSRLLVETAHLDAKFRLEMGDLHYASRSLTRALSIANDNGMILKKISLTILLAQIYLRRGLSSDARLLAETARSLAIRSEYSTAQDEAQEILSRC